MPHAHEGALWDRLSPPMRWIVGVGATIYFGAALLLPLVYWAL